MLLSVLIRALLAVLVLTALVSGPARAFPPASAASVIHARATDWPLFGFDSANTRYSPLTQITVKNVGGLRLAWRREQGFGQVAWESFPIVVGDRMYLTTSTNAVWALNAASGKVRWIYTPDVNFLSGLGASGGDVPVNRGVAVSSGIVYELTYDCHLLALQATTGHLLWRTQVADPRLGYYETMTPTVWNGLVFAGSSGGDNGVRGFVAAYKGRTGRLLWRRWTVPAPGHGWVPAQGHHGGGAVWMPPTVDPTTGILYAGTGNPSPDYSGAGRPGTNPYSDGVLALDARTGRTRWFSSLVGHDEWDYDVGSPVVLFDLYLHGRTFRAVGEAGKSGYYVIMDAHTGRRLFAPIPFVRHLQRTYPDGRILRCPGNFGGSEYSPTALSPHTGTMYVSGITACVLVRREPPQQSKHHAPGQPDLGAQISPAPGRVSGTLSAIDVTRGHLLWQRSMPAPMIGGAVVSASGLVVAGSASGVLYGFDARTGRICWQRTLGASIGSAPILYQIGGREYLAIVTGGAAIAAQLATIGPSGGTLFVFALDRAAQTSRAQ